jgi:hypothetical protein
MSAAVMTERITETSPRFKARRVGGLYFFSLVTAILGETFFRGTGAYAAGLIAVAGMVAMTLLFYDIVKPVNRSVAFVAASLNLVGLSFEALRWNPRGVDIALVFTGLYCLLTGYLIFKSRFLPRVLGALMVLAGLGWVTYLSPALANYLSPCNLAAGLLGEVSVFLWLLVMGVNVERWKEQTSAARKQFFVKG